MQWLSKADNYKYILEVTLNQFKQFEAELDKIRTPKATEEELNENKNT